ncbi:MAG: TfoX/Sxy family protein [Fimbriimonadaceae bacterium]
MPYSAAFLASVEASLAVELSLEARPMFGGAGLVHRGLLFGIVVGSSLYLRADAESEERFLRARCRPFADVPRETGLAFYEVPQDVLSDPAALREWARSAIAAAERAHRAQEPQ